MDLARILRPNYHDKSTRLEYLEQLIASNIVQFFAVFLFWLLANISGLGIEIVNMFMLFIVFPLAMAYAAIASRKRMNDLGDPWWLIFALFIPIINWIFILYLLFAPGKDSPIAEAVLQQPLPNFMPTEKDPPTPLV